MPPLFDMQLRALRRDQAARKGPELFLLERAFADCLERIGLVQQHFRTALLLGSPDAGWRDRLALLAKRVDVLDPGLLFAQASAGSQVIEDAWAAPEAKWDLVLAVGTLDTVNDLPAALSRVRAALVPNGLLIGAMSGGDTLPKLRVAMRAADEVTGFATPHVHPRIEASMLAPLLAGAGFAMPVVDIDRVEVSYRSLQRLVSDLRTMAATNILSERPRRSLSRPALKAAAQAFARQGSDGRTVERFEIQHFAAWSPS